jgi:hypothetical protein
MDNVHHFGIRLELQLSWVLFLECDLRTHAGSSIKTWIRQIFCWMARAEHWFQISARVYANLSMLRQLHHVVIITPHLKFVWMTNGRKRLMFIRLVWSYMKSLLVHQFSWEWISRWYSWEETLWFSTSDGIPRFSFDERSNSVMSAIWPYYSPVIWWHSQLRNQKWTAEKTIAKLKLRVYRLRIERISWPCCNDIFTRPENNRR